MKQALSLLLAIFAPLALLRRALEVVLAWLGHFDWMINDPAQRPDFQRPEGRRCIEGQLAWGEHWVNLIIAARAAELAGVRPKVRFDTSWSGWQPHAPRSWEALMMRYQRLRRSLLAIDRLARRRAARIKREMTACLLRLDAAHQPAVLHTREVLHCQRRGKWQARARAPDGGGCALARGPPPPLSFPELT